MNALKEHLALKPRTRAELRQIHGHLKGVHEFLQDALEAVGGKEGIKQVTRAITEATPWAGVVLDAANESLPPIKFLLKLFEGLTKVEDPNALGLLACTLAFQQAVQQSVQEVLGLEPPRRGVVKKQLEAAPGATYDFTTFSWEAPFTHPFVKDASQALEAFGEGLGFEGPWNVLLQQEVHARFVVNLKSLLSHARRVSTSGRFGSGSNLAAGIRGFAARCSITRTPSAGCSRNGRYWAASPFPSRRSTWSRSARCSRGKLWARSARIRLIKNSHGTLSRTPLPGCWAIGSTATRWWCRDPPVRASPRSRCSFARRWSGPA